MTKMGLSRRIVFRRPFLLAGFDHPHPAGTYSIETNASGSWNAPASPETQRIRVCSGHGVNGFLDNIAVDSGDLRHAMHIDAQTMETV